MSVRDAGHKGGQRVREPVEEGKESVSDRGSPLARSGARGPKKAWPRARLFFRWFCGNDGAFVCPKQAYRACVNGTRTSRVAEAYFDRESSRRTESEALFCALDHGDAQVRQFAKEFGG